MLQGVMRTFAAAVAITAVLSSFAAPAGATQKQPVAQPPGPQRSAAGTVIQPTTTIIHDGYGHTSVIVIPRQRSYLDTGTEVSIGDRNFQMYEFPPGGDPGRSNWFHGPDFQGTGRYPLPNAFDGTGINPYAPY
jgi:hypothetical protein